MVMSGGSRVVLTQRACSELGLGSGGRSDLDESLTSLSLFPCCKVAQEYLPQWLIPCTGAS